MDVGAPAAAEAPTGTSYLAEGRRADAERATRACLATCQTSCDAELGCAGAVGRGGVAGAESTDAAFAAWRSVLSLARPAWKRRPNELRPESPEGGSSGSGSIG